MAKITMLEFSCPMNHIIAALAFDAEEISVEDAKTQILRFLLVNHANPWCKVCGSRELSFKSKETDQEKIAGVVPEFIERTKKDLRDQQFFNNLRRGAQNN